MCLLYTVSRGIKGSRLCDIIDSSATRDTIYLEQLLLLFNWTTGSSVPGNYLVSYAHVAAGLWLKHEALPHRGRARYKDTQRWCRVSKWMTHSWGRVTIRSTWEWCLQNGRHPCTTGTDLSVCARGADYSTSPDWFSALQVYISVSYWPVFFGASHGDWTHGWCALVARRCVTSPLCTQDEGTLS